MLNLINTRRTSSDGCYQSHYCRTGLPANYLPQLAAGTWHIFVSACITALSVTTEYLYCGANVALK